MYDAVGNRLFTRNLTPGLEDRSELYDYDQRHRLRRLRRGIIDGGGASVLVSPIADNDLAAAQDWTILDRRGNWNEFAETIGAVPVTTTQTRTRNGVNEYQAIDPDGPGPQSPVALTHDANGNVTLDPTARNLGDGEGGVPDPSGQVYEYDEENRLTAVRRASDNALLLTIAYDAVGRRVASADYLAAGDPCGGPPALTRHVYAALETLEEHLSCDGGANYALAREFVWGDRFPQPVALITHGGVSGGFGGSSVPASESVYHYLHDVLGSVVALTNAAGQVVERYTYDPYGKTVIEETNPATGLPTARLEGSAFGNPFAWTGQRYDAGVRLYHFQYRTYSPHLGRWLLRDPLGYVDTASLYEYVGSRSLEFVDPLGLQRRPPIAPRPSPQSTQPATQPSSGPTSQPNKPTPDKPVPGIKDHNIPPKINWRKLEIEDYGHRWVQIDGDSYGYWPGGLRTPDPKQKQLDKKGGEDLPPGQRDRYREEPWVFDPDKTCEHGPKKGQSCKDATVQDIKDCVKDCAQNFEANHGPYRVPDNACQSLPPTCLSECCMSQP